ncbi:YfiR family protein [Massilia sp. B-10]|nr:YfiR family protein [Massilia sp. B-10]
MPPGQNSASLERKVKAAFLYKFLGYTEFPASAFSDAAAPVVIGVAKRRRTGGRTDAHRQRAQHPGAADHGQGLP